VRICEDFKEFLTLIGTDFTDFCSGNVKMGKIDGIIVIWADQFGVGQQKLRVEPRRYADNTEFWTLIFTDFHS